MKRTVFGFQLLLTAIALAAVCRADDWPQFRHDSARSGVSDDDLQFPMTQVWSWSKRSKGAHTPLYHVVVWKDYAYFTSSDGSHRSLVCADARTGAVRWQKELLAERLEFAISDIAGPAVTPDGTVFVYDWFTAENVVIQSRGRGQSTSSAGLVEPVNSFCVRSFDAETGAEGPFFPLAAMGANGVLRRLSLLEGLAGQEVRPVPPTFVGCPP